MKVGDLVKRKNIWGEWEKHNPWMADAERDEVGIIVQWEGSLNRAVMWPITGLSWEDEDELFVVKYGKQSYNNLKSKEGCKNEQRDST